jgi:hypothetical protein
MTKKETFQAARNVITSKSGDVTRKALQTTAIRKGRTAEQTSKASTMRLAFWAAGAPAAI